MKKYLFFFILLSAQISFGQRMIFTNPFGGQTSNGGLSSYDFATGQITTPISLPGNPMGLVDGWQLNDTYGYYDGDTDIGDNHRKENGLFAASDGYVYALDQFASSFYPNYVGSAVLYRFRPENPQIEVLHNFNGNIQNFTDLPVGAYKNVLSRPRFGIIEGASGVLYGLCIKGGAYGYGGVWKYEINNRKFTEVSSFNPSSIGYFPSGPLFKAFNNQLYGVLSRKVGSVKDGHLYQILTITDSIVYSNDLEQNQKVGYAVVFANGPVAYDAGNQTLYGARRTFAGGPGYTKGGGLYSFNFNTKQIINLNEIHTDRSVLGSSLMGIVRGNDGGYYGVTEFDGQSRKGTLIVVKGPRLGSADFIKVADFPESPSGNSIIAVADKIFGTYLDYGSHNYGVWCYNISTGTLNSLLPGGFALGYGVLPQLAVVGNMIYARTIFGGKNNSGGIVSINALSLEISSVISAFESTGKSAVGELLDIGNNEYLGFSNTGGNFADNYRNLSGTILRYNLAKKTVISVASLPTMTKSEFDQILPTYNDASSFENYPFTYKPFGMFKASNGKLYFSIQSKENPWLPMVYKQHRAFSRFCEFDPTLNTIKELTNIIYADPHQALEYTPGRFLMRGFDSIVVYDLASNTKIGVQRVPDVRVFGELQGKWLKASNGLIYGTTSINQKQGTINAVLYSIDPSNNFNFNIIADLINANQANLGLTEVNGRIYGSTASGGSNGQGFIFNYDLASKTFNEEYSFKADIDGANFSAGWTLNNGKLYSTSQSGGSNGYGTLVEFTPSTRVLKVLSNLTIQNGNGIFATPIFPVFPLTADSADIIVKDTVICSTSTANLKASTNSVANPIFKWYSDSTLTTLVYTGDNYTTPALTTTTKYFIAVSGTGVNQNVSGNGKKLTVTVNSIPTTPVITADKTAICVGDSALLTSSNVSGNQWYQDAILIPNANQTSYKASSSGNYSVKTTNGTGCSSAISTNMTIQASVIPTTPVVTVDKQLFCAGDVGNLSSSNATGNQWYKDGQAIVGATLQTYKALTTGTYTVRTSSSAVCISPFSLGTVITVNSVPLTPNIVADGKLKICKDENRKLSVSLPQGNTIQWFKNNTLITGAITESILVNETGTYTSKISNASGCISNVSNAVMVEVVCTTAIMMPDVFTPNGDGYNDKVFAIIPGLKYLRTFEVYNRFGNKVFNTADASIGWDGTFKGKPQPSEAYIWVIEGVDGKGETVKKTGTISLIR